MAGFYPLRRRAGIHLAEFSHGLLTFCDRFLQRWKHPNLLVLCSCRRHPKFRGRLAVCAVLRPALTKCAVLQSTLAQIEADCGTLNRCELTAVAEADFGK